MSDLPKKPEYGEMAPEGWVSPVQQSQEQGAQGSAPQPAGVPHNLGVGDSPAPAAPQPHVPNQQVPQAPQQFQPPQAPQPYDAQQHPAPKAPSTADRIITVILLVLGAVGALQFALGMMTLGSQIEMIAVSLGAEGLTLPASFAVLESVGTIVMLSVYAIALIWSIQRLRAKKLTFWVPLSAGVLAVILLFVFSIIAVALVPELLDYATPENIERMLDMSTNLP